ncbi:MULTISPECIES: ATP-dependent Clp protease adapter ClpS [Psychrobacter]|jgi:ATP-dependent Clp protease adaptor protein ClpS|nr:MULTISPECIES: ATP-dependent Clp protease adapter ClpS [Psychrobacter]UNK04675.1 ATP-dependent Clp protease adapter ClpS [Psychrobacter sp. PraFG1]
MKQNKTFMVVSHKGGSADWHHPATLPIARPLKLIDEHTEEEGEVEVLVAEPEITEPPMYAVVMYNDDYTPMEFVVYVLQSEFRHNMDKAVEIMLNIHNQGRGIAGIYPKDIAETKAKKVNQTARKEGYPLLTQIEPHQSS